MRKSFITVIIVCLLCGIVRAETSWDKMLKLYSTAKSYTMDLTVSFRMTGESDPITYKGNVKQLGANYYSSMQGITTVYGPKYWIIAYENKKTMYYGRSNPEVQKSMVNSQKDFADSLLRVATKPRLKSSSSDADVYVFDQASAVYSKIEYTVQPSTGHLVRVVYYYVQSDDVSYEQVAIDYSAITVNQPVADSWFAEKTYFTEKKGLSSGAGKFAGYTVVDQDAQIPQQ